MAWIGTVILDTDKTDVGVAIAVWNKGLLDEFTYSRRVQMTAADKTALVAEAKAALAAKSTKATSETNYSSILTTALNS